MAYGGGFLGGLSEFAGGLAQGIQTEKKMRMEEQEAAMRKAEFDARMDEVNRLKELRKGMGAVAGYQAAPDVSNVLTDEQYEKLGVPAPDPTGMKDAKAPKAGAMPLPEPQVPTPAAEVPAPQAAIPAAPMVPAQAEAQVPTAAPIPAGLPTQGVQAEAAPAPTPQEAPVAEAKPLGKGDYVRARLADGSVGWVPKSNAQLRDAADVTRDMAEAVRAIDPEMYQRMLANSYDLDVKRIQATTARYGDAVAQAARVFQANPEEGVKQLTKAWSLMPDMTDADIKQNDDGTLSVQRYITKGDKKIPVENAQKYKPEDLFRFAVSLASPDAMRQYSVDQAAFAAQEFEKTMKKEEFKLAREKFDFDKMDSNRRYGLSAAAARRSASGGGSSTGGFGTPSTMPVYGVDADGNRVVVGQDVVRKGKGGRIETLSTAFGGYMPYGYDWDRLAVDMQREAGKLNLQVGIDEKTGLPAYRGLRSGKVRPISANTLEQYRRK